jgi:NitT/TauT family transport system substrate-binding protein
MRSSINTGLACRRIAAFAVLALSLALFGVSAAAEPFRIIVPEPETPLVPNSVIDLALQLGYYQKEGVDVELVRVKATPSAVAALRSGQGDMANIGTDIALQLIARGQMDLRGVISPDKALPFLIVAKDAIKTPKQLQGATFGVGQVGSVDYIQTRIVLAALGVDADRLRYLAVGQASYYKAAPMVTKLNVVTAETAKTRHREVEGVVRAILAASRDFARDPELWVDAMVKARPDIARDQLEALARAYRGDWSTDGGLSAPDLAFTTDALYKSEDFKDVPRRVAPADWIDPSFIDAAGR